MSSPEEKHILTPQDIDEHMPSWPGSSVMDISAENQTPPRKAPASTDADIMDEARRRLKGREQVRMHCIVRPSWRLHHLSKDWHRPNKDAGTCQS